VWLCASRPCPCANTVAIADTQTLALVRIESRGLSRIPGERDLQEMFGLTPMQARVLHLLCEGMSVTAVAERSWCRLRS
jgi:hypothetical protein